MEKATLEQIKADLLAKKEKLEAELSKFTRKNIKNDDDYMAKFPDLGDKNDENAQEVELYSDNLSLEYTLESALKDVNSALKRIEDGTYGKCKYCGEEIPEPRLKARPVSTSCVKCKEMLSGM